MKTLRLLACILTAVLGLAGPLAAQDPLFRDGEIPVAVFDSAGGTVVAWVGEDAVGRGVFVRRHDSEGRAAGPARRASAATDVGNPSLAPLAGGGFAVSWTAPDGDGTGLFLRRFDAAGAPLGAEAPVSTPRKGDQSGELRPLPSGGFVAVWTTPAPGGPGVRLALRRYAANGAARGRVVLLAAFGTAETFHAATPGLGDSVLITWKLETAARCPWRARRFALDGRPLGALFGICTFTGEEGFITSPSLAAVRDGYVAVWDGPGSGIFGRRYALSGAPLGPTFRIDQSQSLSEFYGVYGSSVAAAPSGAFAAAWGVEGDSIYQYGDGVEVRAYGPDGEPRAAQLGLDWPQGCLPGDDIPAVAAGPGDRLAVAWEYLCYDLYDEEAPPLRGVSLQTLAIPGPPPPAPGTATFAHRALFGANEEDGFATVKVERTGGSAGVLRVRYETAPGTALPDEDYLPVAGRLVWGDGDASSRTVRIPLVADDRAEGAETFKLLLRPAGGGAVFATATVHLDSPGFLGFPTDELDGFTEVWEGSQVTLTVERYGGRRGEVGVGYTWAEAYGESPIYGWLVWPDGDATPRHITIAIPDDVADGGFWTGWAVLLAELTGGAQRLPSYGSWRHWLAIQDNEVSPAPGRFRLETERYPPPEVQEGAGTAVLQVRRHDGMGGTVSVRWSVEPGTATPGADYRPVSGILAWGDSDVSLKTIRIPLVDDLTPEGDETFAVLLSDPRGGARLGAPARLQVTIHDD